MRDDPYEVEVAADSAEEAIEIASEATPRGMGVASSKAEPVPDKPGLFRVVLHFE